MVFADRIEKTLTIPLDQLRSGKLKKKAMIFYHLYYI